MPSIEVKTNIDASLETCFDLSLDIDLHMQSMEHTNERAIGGITKGKIKLGETVQWKARHFGIYFNMMVQITELSHPFHFTDEMIRGPFKKLKHKHVFEKTGSGTLMIDQFEFESPMGILGKMADAFFLEKYMKKLLKRRNVQIKIVAESTRK